MVVHLLANFLAVEDRPFRGSDSPLTYLDR